MLRPTVFASLLLAVAVSACAQTAAQQAPPKELRAPDVVFVPTPPDVVEAMLTVAKVGKGDVLYDLGSGDGRIPITAARKYGIARGIGIDINPERVKEANENLRKARVVSHQFRMGDWKPERVLEVDGRTLYLWLIPSR